MCTQNRDNHHETTIEKEYNKMGFVPFEQLVIPLVTPQRRLRARAWSTETLKLWSKPGLKKMLQRQSSWFSTVCLRGSQQELGGVVVPFRKFTHGISSWAQVVLVPDCASAKLLINTKANTNDTKHLHPPPIFIFFSFPTTTRLIDFSDPLCLSPNRFC